MSDTNKERGYIAEQKAVDYLNKIGWDILTRNYVYNKGEIDIIARTPDGETVVIVEVKMRSTPDFGDPRDFLKGTQIKKLVATADHFIREVYEEECEVRFDFIGIIENRAGSSIEHLKDAFLHF